MDTHIIKDRAIALDGSWDVVVVGGGPAGCTAAVAAAREGARTLLIEATGCLGGMGTAGLVPAWCPFSDGEKLIYRGLAEKVFLASRKGVPHEPADRLDWVSINAEQLKRVYDELVCEAGVQVLFHTTVAAVEMSDTSTAGVLLAANKGGLTAIGARVYIDATGDGDIAAWAGAPSAKGDENTGTTQPASFCFQLSNVDEYHYQTGPIVHSGSPDSPMWPILRSGRYPLIRDEHLCAHPVGPGAVGFNAGHLWDVDPADPHGFSQAIMLGRRIADQIRAALAEHHPRAFSGAYLATTATLMGLRETRRIMGDYVLTLEDYMARRSFDDEIARNCYFIDIHTAEDEIETVKKLGKPLVTGRFPRYEKGESHGIPYRCLTPKGLRNVLVAGRCISSDHVVQASTRVMPVCLATGEAAGLAAAMAAGGAEADVHAVDANQLRQRLREHGAYLP